MKKYTLKFIAIGILTIVSPIVSFGQSNQGIVNNMEIQIIDKPKILVVGFTLHTSFENNRNKSEIPPFFHSILEEGKLDNITERVNNNQLCIFEMQQDTPDFKYTMGVEIFNNSNISPDMTVINLPASKYVMLKIVKRGPEDVGRAFEYIYKKYIPNSIYVPTGKPAFIYYDDNFFSIYNKDGYKGDPIATVYVPVKSLFIKKIARIFKCF